jgi:hypothetical protein
MLVIVTTAVAKIDAANKRQVAVRLPGAPYDHQLLVVGADKADPHVEKHLAPSRVDHVPEVAVLLGAKAGEVAVRSPKQPFDADAASGRRRKARANGRTGTIVESLVMIASPIGEVEPVALHQSFDHLQQSPEVIGAMDKSLDPISERPGTAVAAARIDPGGLIPAFPSREKPVLGH